MTAFGISTRISPALRDNLDATLEIGQRGMHAPHRSNGPPGRSARVPRIPRRRRARALECSRCSRPQAETWLCAKCRFPRVLWMREQVLHSSRRSAIGWARSSACIASANSPALRRPRQSQVCIATLLVVLRRLQRLVECSNGLMCPRDLEQKIATQHRERMAKLAPCASSEPRCASRSAVS